MLAKLVRNRDPQVFEREFNNLLDSWRVASVTWYSTQIMKAGTSQHIEYSALLLLHGDDQPVDIIQGEVVA